MVSFASRAPAHLAVPTLIEKLEPLYDATLRRVGPLHAHRGTPHRVGAERESLPQCNLRARRA
jgi:hypothetical protein